MAETCLSIVSRLQEAVVRHFTDQCQGKGMACSLEMQGAVARAVEVAIRESRNIQLVDPTVVSGVRLRKSERHGKVADFIVVDDPARGPVKLAVPRDMEMDVVWDRVGRAMIDNLDRQLQADNSPRQDAPPDGNPYSDLPLSENPCRDIPPPELLPRELTAAERDMILASVQEQYGARAEQVERERLAGQGVGSDESLKGIMFCPVCKSTQSGLGVIAGSSCYYGCGPLRQAEGVDIFPAEILTLADIERAICATLAEIGYPPAPRLLAALAARLVDEVAKAADISPDGRPAIGRPQALRNLNWLLRNKFPPEKIDAARIARLGISEAR
jgi:hypothetical protein